MSGEIHGRDTYELPWKGNRELSDGMGRAVTSNQGENHIHRHRCESKAY